MGLPISIDMLLHGKAVEWERLEFKAGWNPLDVLQTICAFANDFHNLGGGYIVVGVAEEDGCPLLPPSGIESTQLNTIQKEILSLGHSAMQPQYHPIVVPEMVAGKHVLIVWAPGGAKDGDTDAEDMVLAAESLTVELSGALDRVGEDHEPESGLTVALLKRALKQLGFALGASEKVAERNVMNPAVLKAFRNDMFDIREKILTIMSDLRSRAE